MNTPTDPFFTYLSGLPSRWQRMACDGVIAAIRASGHFEEDIKWNNPYFWVPGAAAIKLFCATSWINVYFYRGHELDDPAHLLHPDTSSAMRKIRIRETTVIEVAALQQLIEQAHALHSLAGPKPMMLLDGDTTHTNASVV